MEPVSGVMHTFLRFPYIHQWVAANWPVDDCWSAEWCSKSGMFFNGINEDQLNHENSIDGIDDRCIRGVCDGRKTALPLPFAAFLAVVHSWRLSSWVFRASKCLIHFDSCSTCSSWCFNLKHVFHHFSCFVFFGPAAASDVQPLLYGSRSWEALRNATCPQAEEAEAVAAVGLFAQKADIRTSRVTWCFTIVKKYAIRLKIVKACLTLLRYLNFQHRLRHSRAGRAERGAARDRANGRCAKRKPRAERRIQSRWLRAAWSGLRA